MPPASPRPDQVDRAQLERPARHVARAVARARLRRVLEAAPPTALPLQDEALHDFRVALRRLRTWLRAFRGELEDTVGRGALRRLRRVAKATDQARDLEVQVAWLSHPTVRLGRLATGAAAFLAERLDAERKVAVEEALEAVADRLPRAAARLDRQLKRYEVRVSPDPDREEPSADAALRGLLGESLAELQTAMVVVTSAEQVTEAHQARLAVKHLRYLVEALAPAHRGSWRAARQLAALQDALGLLHDRHLLLARVRNEAARPRTGDPRPPTQRAFRSLASALTRSARREFSAAQRILRGRAFQRALATIVRLAGAPAPEPPLPAPPTAPLPEVPVG